VPGATLFKCDLPIGNNGAPGTNRARTLLPGEQLDRKLADLVVANNPTLAGPIAAHTFDRWKADERFNHTCVSLIEDERDLIGVALVYPLVHTDDTEAAASPVSWMSRARFGALCRRCSADGTQSKSFDRCRSRVQRSPEYGQEGGQVDR
jgi:hypothetical protein